MATSLPSVSPASIAESSLPSPAIGTASRIHYLDNLRAMAMMLGVFLHAGLAYAEPAQAIWIATDTGSSVLMDATIWFIHLFRMSLFFMLSGYFAKIMLQKYGLRSFLWKRTIRLVFPFLLFYPFLLVGTTAVIIFALGYLTEPEGVMGLIAEGSRSGGAGQEKPPPTTMHLWFLYYLAMFTLLGAWLDRVAFVRWPARWSHPLLCLILPLLLVPAVLAAGTPLPAPESFLPTWWPFAFYGLFFAAGWQGVGREGLIEWLTPYRWWLALGCTALFVPYYLTLPKLDLDLILQGSTGHGWTQRLISSTLTAYLSVGLTILSLIWGKQLLNRKRFGLRFLADASYWVYLIHLPIVLFLQTLLIPTPLHWSLKLGLVLVVTLGLCLGSYVTFVRYTPLGWLLHGKREFP